MQTKPFRLHGIFSPWIPIVAALDFCVAYLSGAFAAFVRSMLLGQPTSWDVDTGGSNLALFVGVAFPLGMQLFGFYGRLTDSLVEASVWRRICVWTALFISLLTYFFASKSGHEYSRLWIGLWFSVGVVLFPALAFTILRIQTWHTRRGIGIRRVLLIGSGPLARRTAKVLDSHPACGLIVMGYLSESDQEEGIELHPCLGIIEDIPNLAATGTFDEAWVTLPLTEQPRIQGILREMRQHMVDVRLVPDIFAFELVNRNVSDIFGLPVIGLMTNPQRGVDRLIKRLMDFFGAIFALLILSPILVVCALGIRMNSKGPVIFVQERHGQDGNAFMMYKFRTMYTDSNSSQEPFRQATRDDPRVTSAGKLMRRHSLDELPQLFNVLKGDMSLVGPRPHAVDMNHMLWNEIDRYALRHRVKPGLTGWAQVLGFRGETKDRSFLSKRIELDLFYIDNWSLMFDIRIILRTLIVAWRQPMAY